MGAAHGKSLSSNRHRMKQREKQLLKQQQQQQQHRQNHILTSVFGDSGVDIGTNQAGKQWLHSAPMAPSSRHMLSPSTRLIAPPPPPAHSQLGQQQQQSQPTTTATILANKRRHQQQQQQQRQQQRQHSASLLSIGRRGDASNRFPGEAGSDLVVDKMYADELAIDEQQYYDDYNYDYDHLHRFVDDDCAYGLDVYNGGGGGSKYYLDDAAAGDIVDLAPQHWQHQSSGISSTTTTMVAAAAAAEEEGEEACDLCARENRRRSLAWKRSQAADRRAGGAPIRANGSAAASAALRNGSESSLHLSNGARYKHQQARVSAQHLGPSAYLVDRQRQGALFPPQLAPTHSGSSGSRVVAGSSSSSRHLPSSSQAAHHRRRRAQRQQQQQQQQQLMSSSHTLAGTTATPDFLLESSAPTTTTTTTTHRTRGGSVMQSSSSSGAGTAASASTGTPTGTRAAPTAAEAAAAAATTTTLAPTDDTISPTISQQTAPITCAMNNNTVNNNSYTMTPGAAVKCTGQMARNQCGLAMSHKQREKHNLIGLLPAAVQEQELQASAVLNYLDKCQDELSKYVYLRNLKDFNERLYYYTLTRNVEKLMPLVYTPTVGLACQRFSEIYQRPRGVFVTINDLGRVSKLLANWPEKDVRVIVVTDGERILGLGDLGANGMGISIGKLSLYTALAGIPPENVLPITIDVGTNTEQYLKDPFYIGLRHKRVRGDQYDALLDEFMQAVVDRWGPSCLIQFEDFANSTAFVLLERYRDRYCTFNDDIQGTASVCLSGLITAAKEIRRRLADCSFLFYGAGEANLGTAHLLVMAMVEDGLSKDEAKKRVWLVDSKGLVVASRSDLTGHKREFAQPVDHIKDLESIIDFVKPTAIVGASAQGGSFNESICKKMAQFNDRPIIFALSNPTQKAECTAAQAYQWTSGRCVYASGSPFDPVDYDGKTYITGQGNNAYIFPGVGLAAIGAHTHTIPEETFLIAARALSDQVTASDTGVGLVYPRLNKIREVTLGVAARVLEYFYAERLATYRPEPSDKREFLRQIQYQPRYELDEV